MKRFNYLFISMLLLCVFIFSANSAFAFEFNFYYQEIVEVYDPASTAPNEGLGDKICNWLSPDSKTEIKKSSYKEDGHDKIAYKVRTRKVTSLAELYKQMGVTQEDYDNNNISNGQRAIIDIFKSVKDSTKNQAIMERTQHADKKKCDVYLIDSSDFDNTASQYVKDSLSNDFWSQCSANRKEIQMGTINYCNDSSSDRAVSTFLHEYSHSLDKSVFHEIHPYGKDGTHYYNEVISKSAAFKEAWAEYNEMIESENRKNYYYSYSTPNQELIIEKGKGDYSTKVKASEATAEQLLRNECFMNRLLYRLHEVLGKDANGDDIVSKAFYETNGLTNDMSKLIKQLIKDNPESTIAIYEVIDEVTFNKMSDKDFKKFVGKSDKLEEYLNVREDNSKGSVGENSATRAKSDTSNNSSIKDTPKISSGSIKLPWLNIKDNLTTTASGSGKLPVLRKLSNEEKDTKGKGVVIEIESDDPFGE